MIEKLEEFTWYNGLYNEIVVEDCYKLRKIPFIPDIVFDIGSNVGVFTRFAKSLWDNCEVIAVEASEENCMLFSKFTDLQNVTLLNNAIGIGKVYQKQNTINNVFTYMSKGICGEMIEVDIPTITPIKLLEQYRKSSEKVLFKMDVEGGEYCLFDDVKLLEIIKTCEYVAIEFHWYVYNNENLQREDFQKIYTWLSEFYETHWYTITNDLFIAVKKHL